MFVVEEGKAERLTNSQILNKCGDLMRPVNLNIYIYINVDARCQSNSPTMTAKSLASSVYLLCQSSFDV